MLEELRKKLHCAIDEGNPEKILKASRELDEEILKYIQYKRQEVENQCEGSS